MTWNTSLYKSLLGCKKLATYKPLKKDRYLNEYEIKDDFCRNERFFIPPNFFWNSPVLIQPFLTKRIFIKIIFSLFSLFKPSLKPIASRCFFFFFFPTRWMFKEEVLCAIFFSLVMLRLLTTMDLRSWKEMGLFFLEIMVFSLK